MRRKSTPPRSRIRSDGENPRGERELSPSGSSFRPPVASPTALAGSRRRRPEGDAGMVSLGERSLGESSRREPQPRTLGQNPYNPGQNPYNPTASMSQSGRPLSGLDSPSSSIRYEADPRANSASMSQVKHMPPVVDSHHDAAISELRQQIAALQARVTAQEIAGTLAGGSVGVAGTVEQG
eukprot:Hpha_TRINITY_DN28244_c0_g1::TRINITY_DN28244_c0_g1_i1::g.116778::m.116778